MPSQPLLFLLLILVLAVPAAAQDRAGRDTPGEWKVTHFQPFGLWDSMCDMRRTGELLEERCYVRYVDVYSQQPKFGAAFSFIVPEARDGAVTAEFGFERGIRFKDNGFRLESAGATVLSLDMTDCARGGTCALDSELMAEIERLAATAPEVAFAISLTGRYGRDWELRWSSDKLHMAIDDMRMQARRRSLID